MHVKDRILNNPFWVSRITGLLFIVATVTYSSGSATIEPFLQNPQGMPHQVIWGAFLELIDVLAVIGIGLLLFSVIRQYNKPIALSYLGTRLFEAVCLIISVIAILFGMSSMYEYAFQLAMLGLGLGSLPFCYFLYRSRLLPRLLAVLGFAGYIFLFLWAILEIFGYSASMMLFAPGAVFEVAFPIWLIVKGFKRQ